MTFLHRQTSSKAFTIVEIVIVIAVIGILASISIVSYNGYQERARAAAAIAGVNQATDLLEAYQLKNGGLYPSTLAAAGVTDNNSVEYQYTQVSGGTNYCVTATSKNVSYMMSQDAKPVAGGCAGHGANGVPAITNLALNPSMETDMTSTGNIGSTPGVVVRSTEQAKSGSASLKLTQASGRGWFVSDGIFAAGDTVKWSFWVYSNTAFSVPPYWERSTTYTGGGGGAGVSVPVNTWTKVTGTLTLTSTQVAGTLFKFGYHRGTPTTGEVVYIDDVMITKGSTLYNFADGRTTNWIWNGAANNSTSTGPPI